MRKLHPHLFNMALTVRSERLASHEPLVLMDDKLTCVRAIHLRGLPTACVGSGWRRNSAGREIWATVKERTV